jgi:hypothetical protein
MAMFLIGYGMHMVATSEMVLKALIEYGLMKGLVLLKP